MRLFSYHVYLFLAKMTVPQLTIFRFLQVRENWIKSGNLSGQNKGQRKILFLEKSVTVCKGFDFLSNVLGIFSIIIYFIHPFGVGV